MESDNSPIIARLSVRRVAPSQYLFEVSHGGEVLYEDACFTSIEEAISAASNQQGPIRGFEVAYQGLVVGTYLCEEIEHVVEEVAERAVELVAAVR